MSKTISIEGVYITHNFWIVFLACMLFFIVDTSYAAVEVVVVNERIVKEKKHIYSIKVLVKGEKIHYTFFTDDFSEVNNGASIISHDGGKTNYFIDIDEESDTDEKVCHYWTNKETVAVLGKYLLKITGRFNVDVSKPAVNKVFNKKSENIHGLPTRHLRMKTDFVVSYKFMFFDNTLKVERQLDSWTTPQIEGMKVKPILQKSWQATGYQQIDHVLSEASKLLKGYRLRSETRQTITDKKGKKKETKITQYVKSIKQIENLSDDVFKLPNCRKIDSYDMEQRVKHLLFVLAGKPL